MRTHYMVIAVKRADDVDGVLPDAMIAAIVRGLNRPELQLAASIPKTLPSAQMCKRVIDNTEAEGLS